MKRILYAAVAVLVINGLASSAGAFGIFDAEADGLHGGSRWDFASIYFNGNERSLQGGLRYSLQGGSYQAFKNQFTWEVVPTNAQFKRTVRKAFEAWTTVDPATGFGTKLRFQSDLSTPVSRRVVSSVRLGAEIDLFAAMSASNWDIEDENLQGETAFSSRHIGNKKIRLTSGTTGYSGYAITGADITLNSNPEAIWTLGWFRLVLAHEIGHALGLADVDVVGPDGMFIDDNYEDERPAKLRNSFAAKINTTNPAASGHLHLYEVPNDEEGLEHPAVNILMESELDSELYMAYPYLSNDDYAGRQFLYPYVTPPQPWDLVSGKLSGAEATLSHVSGGNAGLLTDTRSIPEPASGALVLAGLLVLRRRTSRAG
ncbi:MAG: hypothetical protein IT445_18415 [Phycisphaeraceae bacterium]|nr:hypothetical protein [Phycisphaeraceae bacterium]